MEQAHYIQYIQLLIDENIYTKYLKQGQLPETEFEIPESYTEISARAYCNVHGLWKSK
jgi:superoxide reductase